MANETLTGCVDWSTGDIEFDQDTCTYTGCINWTGAHAGQVAVTVSTDCCDDTYYGCVDWSTGNFEVSLPDDCCICTPTSCPCSITGWDDFLDAGFQPKYISLTASVNYCDGQYTVSTDFPGSYYDFSNFDCPNGSYTLTHNNGCLYNTSLQSCTMTWEHWVEDRYDPGTYFLFDTTTINGFRYRLYLNYSNDADECRLYMDYYTSTFVVGQAFDGTFTVNSSTGHVSGSGTGLGSLNCTNNWIYNKWGGGTFSISSSNSTGVCTYS